MPMIGIVRFCNSKQTIKLLSISGMITKEGQFNNFLFFRNCIAVVLVLKYFFLNLFVSSSVCQLRKCCHFKTSRACVVAPVIDPGNH
jgi:hypothetical protein